MKMTRMFAPAVALALVLGACSPRPTTDGVSPAPAGASPGSSEPGRQPNEISPNQMTEER